MVVGRNRVGIVELSMVRTCPPRSSNNFANFIRRPISFDIRTVSSQLFH